MKRYLMLGFFLVLFIFSKAQQERKYIRQGNREYNKATVDTAHVDTTRYLKAETDYRKALDKDPNYWAGIYNLANSQYRQRKFEDATKQYMAATGMENKNKKEVAMAYHNLGNTYLESQKLSEAVEAYKNALRNNPNDLETKYNLAWAQDKLKQQQEQEKKGKGNDDEGLSEFAKQLKRRAQELVRDRKYHEAYQLMLDGEQKDPTVSKIKDFTERIKKVDNINN